MNVKAKTKVTMTFVAVIVLACVSIAGCAPQGEGGSTPATQDKQAATAAAWSPTVDCSACHADQTASQEDSSCLVSLHATQNVGCVTCHPAEELAPVHEEHGQSGRMPTKLRYTDVNNEGCLDSACHVSREALAEKTAEVKNIVDSKGTAANPHQLPAHEDHEALVCTDCHVMHEASDMTEETLDTCFGCHHQEVFECGTCHE